MQNNNDWWCGIGCLVGFVVFGVALSIGVCVGGAYLIITAANILFDACWPYDFKHVAVIAGVLFLLGLFFGGSRVSSSSSRRE